MKFLYPYFFSSLFKGDRPLLHKGFVQLLYPLEIEVYKPSLNV